MALELKTIQPVTIDGEKCCPVVNPESRLRLSDIKFDNQDNIEAGIKVILDCFPDKKSYLAKKLPDMTPFDLQQLQAYLLAGDSGLKMINEAVEKAMGSVNV